LSLLFQAPVLWSSPTDLRREKKERKREKKRKNR
jgi:hypothetical protein